MPTFHCPNNCAARNARFRSFRDSGWSRIGVPIPVIERLLNHISGSFGGIVGVYQRYDFMLEMRDAIERWEVHVGNLVQR